MVTQATGKELPYTIAPRRAGDNGNVYADASKAKQLLGREATQPLVDAIRAQWEFVERNVG